MPRTQEACAPPVPCSSCLGRLGGWGARDGEGVAPPEETAGTLRTERHVWSFLRLRIFLAWGLQGPS